MLRGVFQPVRDLIQTKSTKWRIWAVVICLSYALIIGGIINLMPFINGWVKLGFFALALAIAMAALLLIVPKYVEEQKENEAHRQHDETNTQIPPKPSMPPTNAIEHKSLTEPSGTNISIELSSNKPPRRRWIRRRLFRELIEEDNIHFLVIHSYTPIPQGRFKKRLWKHRTQKIELDNSPDVDIKLATKIPIFPTDKETKIFCLERLHWWSHGPAQLGIIACAIAVMLPVSLLGSRDNNWTARLVSIAAIACGFGIWYFIIWMRWAYTYLIFTNSKIRLLYRPPFNLPSQTPSTDLVKLTGGIKPSSSWWGNNLHYGTIQTETVANVVDDWLLKLVRYVKDYERKAQLLEQLREDAENELTSS
jgi:hypothetical protein